MDGQNVKSRFEIELAGAGGRCSGIPNCHLPGFWKKKPWDTAPGGLYGNNGAEGLARFSKALRVTVLCDKPMIKSKP